MSLTQFHGFAVDGFNLTGLDDSGCLWTVENPSGWYTGGEVRGATEARPQQDGDWRGTVRRAGRIITLQGKVFCPDTAAMEAAARRFSAILSGGWGELVGESAAGVLGATVQLEDLPLFDSISDRAATWQLAVGAESPLLYGPATFAQTALSSSGAGTGRVWPRVWPTDWGVPAGVTPGAVQLANAGTAGYWPRIRIDGPVTNPVLTLNETGDTVRFNGSVAAGQWLDVECDKRRVTLNGVASRRFAVSASGNWLAIPPGGGSLSAAADSSGASTLVSVWGYEGAWQ